MSLHDRYWVRHDDDTVAGTAWGMAPIYMRVFEVPPGIEGSDGKPLTDAEKQEFVRLFLAMANREADPEMTRGERAILDVCRAHWARTGFFPSSGVIAQETSLSPYTISVSLRVLARLNVLEPPESGVWAGRMRVPAPRMVEDHLREPAS
jgi:hypothetical protein